MDIETQKNIEIAKQAVASFLRDIDKPDADVPFLLKRLNSVISLAHADLEIYPDDDLPLN